MASASGARRTSTGWSRSGHRRGAGTAERSAMSGRSRPCTKTKPKIPSGDDGQIRTRTRPKSTPMPDPNYRHEPRKTESQRRADPICPEAGTPLRQGERSRHRLAIARRGQARGPRPCRTDGNDRRRGAGHHQIQEGLACPGRAGCACGARREPVPSGTGQALRQAPEGYETAQA